jgi:hypothetical protein
MNGLFIPYKTQQHLHAICYLTNWQYLLGKDYDAHLITRQLAAEWIR